MAIDNTVGGENSNSYVTVAESNVYFLDRYSQEVSPEVATGWFLFSEGQKTARLLYACRILERLKYLGVRVDDIQNLSWPRKIVSGEYRCGWHLKILGKEIEDDEIPSEIKNAQNEIALTVFDSDGNLTRPGNITQDGAVIVQETLRNWAARYSEDGPRIASISNEVYAFLCPFLDDSISLRRE